MRVIIAEVYTMHMNKGALRLGAIGGMTVGAVFPWLWGDYNTFGLASLFWAMIGGFAGIWLVAWASKKIGI